MQKVSVIITCYNHAGYLAEAIESVRSQSWKPIEIIVVDDGSTDHTGDVARAFSDVNYIHQQNQGLSAARNTGIQAATGDFILFLDADDYLLSHAIYHLVEGLSAAPDAAFISAAHIRVDKFGNKIRASTPPRETGFSALLKSNYIGMHAAVLYRSTVLKTFRFRKLAACEDYDMYLSVARHHPVVHRDTLVAAYRIHGENMSANISLMLSHVTRVLKSHREACKNAEEHAALKEGLLNWKTYYGDEWTRTIRTQMKDGRVPDLNDFKFAYAYSIRKGIGLTLHTVNMMFKKLLKAVMPSTLRRFLTRSGLMHDHPPIGKIDFGDLGTTKPISRDFGFDRGGPVDRYYIEHFLEQNKLHIRNRVLEIGDAAYTRQFGGNRVVQSDVLHIEKANEEVTIIGDLANAPHIPDNSFDCIILTQTLHLIYDYQAALRTCHRILKPGGKLLLTTPGITPIDSGRWREYWLWSFTEAAMRRVLATIFDDKKTSLHTYGNVYAATCFIQGIGLPETDLGKLLKQDLSYPVIIGICAEKS